MKKIIQLVSVAMLIILVFSTNVFAGMKIHGEFSPYNPSDPAYTAIIYGVDYFYNHGKQMISISLIGDKPSDRNIEIDFYDDDLLFGMTMTNAIGKSVTIYFANSNFDIEQLHVDQSRNSSSFKALKRYHLS